MDEGNITLSNQNQTAFTLNNDWLRTDIALVSYSTLLVIGSIGNGLVILQFYVNKYTQNPTFIVICGLAMADLFMILVRLTKELIDITNASIITMVTCKLSLYLMQVCAYSASYHLVLLSIVRYVSIVHPFTAEKYLTNATTWRIVIGVWGVILVATSPLLLFTTTTLILLNRNTYHTCLLTSGGKSRMKELLICFSIFSYIVPLAMLIIFHVTKVRTVVKVMETITNDERRKVTYMVILVILLFTILLFPVHCKNLIILSGANPATPLMQNLDILFRVLAYTNNCINPFIYGIMSKSFRRGIQNIFRCRKQNSVDVSFTGTTSVST